MKERLASLFPPGVVVSYLRDPRLAEGLHPAEEPAVAKAGEKRRGDFVAGRHCARGALAELGVRGVALPKCGDGTVDWPAGTTGSLTHCTDFYAAAVSPREVCGSLGLDAEVRGRVGESLVRAVTTEHERGTLAELARADAGPWLDLVFSAKEAFYKAQFPRSDGAWIGFGDVSLVEVREGRGGPGECELRLEKDIEGLAPAGTAFGGRWFRTPVHVVTGFWFAP